MRLDKFLKVSRLIKRRTVANEACDAGRVMVNGKPAKASVNVKVGDVIEIAFGTKSVKVRVLDLQDTTKKEEAKDRLVRDYPQTVFYRKRLERPEVKSLMEQCNCVVCASRDDPMPTFVTEGLIFGTIAACVA